MAKDTSNDNNLLPADAEISPDAHGHAAILLVESLIHGLIARSVISVAEAVEIVNIAADVREIVALDQGQPPSAIQKSRTLLDNISKSLKFDIPR